MVIKYKDYKYYLLPILAVLAMAITYYFLFNQLKDTKSTNYTLTVEGSSMHPTFQDGDEIEYTASYSREDITNGTVVIFFAPENRNSLIVKRVVGIEGNLIEIKDNTLYRDKEEVEFNKNDNNTSYYIYEMSKQVEKDEVFVVGDNYNNSKDSRNYGSIPISTIRGIVKE
jgi:signal peptidase I